ncbi:hypothetical protein [Streptomyces virginiae]|uniref:hypothetical protein n=1 Tax=Streptomyces virginiae TaxID=1961 RepID=UPI00342D3754
MTAMLDGRVSAEGIGPRDRLVMTIWALIALLCGLGFLLALLIGAVSAALPHSTASQWPDRLRRGAAAFGIALTLYIALVGMVVGLAVLLGMRST